MTFDRVVMLTAWTVFMLIVVSLFSIGSLLGDCADSVSCDGSRRSALLTVIGIGIVIYSAGVVWMTRRRGS